MASLHRVSNNPDPGAAASRAARRRFLGEELTPGSDTPWLVKAVLGGAPPLEITRDGVIPPRPSRVLPLRHGLTAAGLPAKCLLDGSGLVHLRSEESAGADPGVDCAACRAWQATHVDPPRRSPPVMARIRAALEEVFTKAA